MLLDLSEMKEMCLAVQKWLNERFCNSDYWGISQLHGILIRQGTCGNCDKCDYCVVGGDNSMAKEYEIVKEEKVFLVSR